MVMTMVIVMAAVFTTTVMLALVMVIVVVVANGDGIDYGDIAPDNITCVTVMGMVIMTFIDCHLVSVISVVNIPKIRIVINVLEQIICTLPKQVQ